MNTTSAIPDVIDALFTQCGQALPNVTVSDGFGVTDSAGEFLFIGVESPDDEDSSTSAESSQQAATFGTDRPRQEDGTITCAALSSNGNTNGQKAARDAVFALAKSVADLCRADPALGVTGYRSLVTDYGTTQRLTQNQYDNGVDAILTFTVRFRARI